MTKRSLSTPFKCFRNCDIRSASTIPHTIICAGYLLSAQEWWIIISMFCLTDGFFIQLLWYLQNDVSHLCDTWYIAFVCDDIIIFILSEIKKIDCAYYFETFSLWLHAQHCSINNSYLDLANHCSVQNDDSGIDRFYFVAR